MQPHAHIHTHTHTHNHISNRCVQEHKQAHHHTSTLDLRRQMGRCKCPWACPGITRLNTLHSTGHNGPHVVQTVVCLAVDRSTLCQLNNSRTPLNMTKHHACIATTPGTSTPGTSSEQTLAHQAPAATRHQHTRHQQRTDTSTPGTSSDQAPAHQAPAANRH